MQQGIKKLQWFEYLVVVFLEILNTELCRVFANQVTCTYAPCIAGIAKVRRYIATNRAQPQPILFSAQPLELSEFEKDQYSNYTI